MPQELDDPARAPHLVRSRCQAELSEQLIENSQAASGLLATVTKHEIVIHEAEDMDAHPRHTSPEHLGYPFGHRAEELG